MDIVESSRQRVLHYQRLYILGILFFVAFIVLVGTNVYDISLVTQDSPLHNRTADSLRPVAIVLPRFNRTRAGGLFRLISSLVREEANVTSGDSLPPAPEEQ